MLGYTIDELNKGYRKKEYSPYEIAKYYLDRIEQDRLTNSFIDVFPKRVLSQSLSISTEINSIYDKLYGIPLSYKDSIDIEGELTTNGSIVHSGKKSKLSARVVDILESKKSITLGKNNMHEFSTGVTSENKFYGDVINPLNTQITAGGSSSGSASAVAAGLTMASICTDTSGSTRIPAACCGVLGMKPTYQIGTMHSITPISNTLDHIGIIAKNVEDMSIITAPIITSRMPVFSKDNLRDINVGIDFSYFDNNVDIEISQMMKKVINELIELGAQIKEVNLDFFNDIVPYSRVIGTSEAAYLHKDMYRKYSGQFDNQLFKTIEKGKSILAENYIEALHQQRICKELLEIQFQEVHVILTPTMPLVTPEITRIQNWDKNEDIGDCMVRYTQPFNITGNPALSLPTKHIVKNIPQSIQIIAKHNKEHQLFEIGKILEREYIMR